VAGHLDLTQLPDAAHVIDDLAGTLGGLDGLVQCSGTGTGTLLLDLDYDLWRDVVATDLHRQRRRPRGDLDTDDRAAGRGPTR
jgi:NAD(P)-dependent dehydrogenase (short-subunit alcohol dehydrogenase family)